MRRRVVLLSALITLALVIGVLVLKHREMKRAEVSTPEPVNAPVRSSVLTTLPYPRLANYYLAEGITMDEAEQLGRWPYVVTSWDVQSNSPEPLYYLRSQHPDIVLLAYFASNEFTLKTAETPPYNLLWANLTDSDWLYTPKGEHVSFWEGCWSYNLTQRTTTQKLINHVLANLSPVWNGIFWDNIWEEVRWYNSGQVDSDGDGQADNMSEFNHGWVRNEQALLGLSRLGLNDRYVVANMGGANQGEWLVNGRMFEGFPNCLGNSSPATLNRLLGYYLEMCEDVVPPQLIIVHGSGEQTDSAAVRFGLTFTLMGDGFFAYDTGPSYHHCLWWYDKYYQSIGYPLGQAEEDPTGVWVREFGEPDNPIFVFWNPTFQNHVFEFGYPDGSSDEITVPKRDGIIHHLTKTLALASP